MRACEPILFYCCEKVQRPWPLLPPQLLRHCLCTCRQDFEGGLLNKISGIRLNFVITETFQKLPPPPPPPPPPHIHTNTQKVCFLDARALRTVGSARARCVCVCGGGGGAGGGGNFMTGAAFNMNGGGGGRPPQGYARSATAVLVCLLAAILVIILRLFKKVVYRLALYQVLASLALATNMILQNILLDYNHNYGRQCIAMGWLLLYAEWMKLLFTMWVTFHLFCFAVLHKNLKKFVIVRFDVTTHASGDSVHTSDNQNIWT